MPAHDQNSTDKTTPPTITTNNDAIPDDYTPINSPHEKKTNAMMLHRILYNTAAAMQHDPAINADPTDTDAWDDYTALDNIIAPHDALIADRRDIVTAVAHLARALDTALPRPAHDRDAALHTALDEDTNDPATLDLALTDAANAAEDARHAALTVAADEVHVPATAEAEIVKTAISVVRTIDTTAVDDDRDAARTALGKDIGAHLARADRFKADYVNAVFAAVFRSHVRRDAFITHAAGGGAGDAPVDADAGDGEFGGIAAYDELPQRARGDDETSSDEDADDGEDARVRDAARDAQHTLTQYA